MAWPISLFRAAGALRGLGFGAGRDVGEHRGVAGRQVQRQAGERLFASGRVSCSVKLVNAPACRLVAPAVKMGANGCGFGHGGAVGAGADREFARRRDCVRSWRARDQGVKSASVW